MNKIKTWFKTFRRNRHLKFMRRCLDDNFYRHKLDLSGYWAMLPHEYVWDLQTEALTQKNDELRAEIAKMEAKFDQEWKKELARE